MRISIEHMKLLKKAPNSAYNDIMPEFLFHSNKLEGSTFSEAELEKLVESGLVTGSHTIDDVLETKNSIDAFGFVIDSLGDPIDKDFLCKLNAILMDKTQAAADGFSGRYKVIPNRIRNSGVQVALPSDVNDAMESLLSDWESRPHNLESIAAFHIRFEHIHPFQDGNGRIGRFLMLKQCIENDIDLIVIDQEYGDSYKAWLEVAQTQGDAEYFIDVLIKCQERFEEKMRERGVCRLLSEMP
ncbi:MAG TPA: Fic family protein [Candidatus Rubneribacter avistercoris]|nr:Fic family protein [Candidatus Rubneribacter avistercoris]